MPSQSSLVNDSVRTSHVTSFTYHVTSFAYGLPRTSVGSGSRYYNKDAIIILLSYAPEPSGTVINLAYKERYIFSAPEDAREPVKNSHLFKMLRTRNDNLAGERS